MKKRCTNSACRKEFRLLPGSAICPHCGKLYRRICTPAPVRKADSHKAALPKRNGFAVVLSGWQGQIRNRVAIVKALRTERGMTIRAAVEATKRSTIVAENLSWAEAERFGLALEHLGGIVALVPTVKAEKYGVPLFGG